MLTQLFIDNQTFNALQLLALQQQVWPKRTKATGSGGF